MRWWLKVEGPSLAVLRGFDLVWKAMLEATACPIEAETKRAEGAAKKSTLLQLIGLCSELGAVSRLDPLFTAIERL